MFKRITHRDYCPYVSKHDVYKGIGNTYSANSIKQLGEVPNLFEITSTTIINTIFNEKIKDDTKHIHNCRSEIDNFITKFTLPKIIKDCITYIHGKYHTKSSRYWRLYEVHDIHETNKRSLIRNRSLLCDRYLDYLSGPSDNDFLCDIDVGNFDTHFEERIDRIVDCKIALGPINQDGSVNIRTYNGSIVATKFIEVDDCICTLEDCTSFYNTIIYLQSHKLSNTLAAIICLNSLIILTTLEES